MVVWFRYGSCTVGVEDGVVRAADFASLTDLFEAAQTLQTERDRLLATAEQEIAEMRAQAEEEVENSVAFARQARDSAYAEGMAKGLEDASAKWMEGALREAASTQRSLMRQTQRLSQIVALALERIVDQEDRATLFKRSLNAISKLVRDVPMATLRVSPAELESAMTAVASFAPVASGRLQLEVKGDSSLVPGSCLFESDQGVIDAGLKTQLAAIQRAMDRAAQYLVLEDVSEPSSEAEAEAEVVALETPAAAGHDAQLQQAHDDTGHGAADSGMQDLQDEEEQQDQEDVQDQEDLQDLQDPQDLQDQDDEQDPDDQDPQDPQDLEDQHDLHDLHDMQDLQELNDLYDEDPSALHLDAASG